jgi:hypothetical protein
MPGTSHPGIKGYVRSRTGVGAATKRAQRTPRTLSSSASSKPAPGTAAACTNTRTQPRGHADPATAPPVGTKISPEIGSTATEWSPLKVAMGWMRFGTAPLKSITPSTRVLAALAGSVSPVAKHRMVVGSHHTSSPLVSCANCATRGAVSAVGIRVEYQDGSRAADDIVGGVECAFIDPELSSDVDPRRVPECRCRGRRDVVVQSKRASFKSRPTGP